jgi:hypothetical protein
MNKKDAFVLWFGFFAVKKTPRNSLFVMQKTGGKNGWIE